MFFLTDCQLGTCACAVDSILRASNPQDPLRPIILRVSRMIARAFIKRVPTAIEAARALFARARGDPSMNDVERALKAAAEATGMEWTDETANPIRIALEKAYQTGRKEPLKPLTIKPTFNLVDEAARQWLQRDTLYWVGNAWDGGLGQQIANAVRVEVIEKGLSRRDGAKRLAEILGERLDKSEPYWQMVSGAAAVRGRSFGNVSSFEEAAVKRYQYLAMMDFRTSAICRHLNGRQWTVETAIRLRDAHLAGRSPEDAKRIQPWLPEAQVLKMDSKQLEAAGVIVPPVHGNCRSTLVVAEVGKRERLSKEERVGLSKRAWVTIGATLGISVAAVAVMGARIWAQKQREVETPAFDGLEYLLLHKIAGTNTSIGSVIPADQRNLAMLGEVLKMATRKPPKPPVSGMPAPPSVSLPKDVPVGWQ